MIRTILYPAKTDWHALLNRPVMDSRAVVQVVTPILDDVRERGDEALKEYTLNYDQVDLQTFQVSEDEFTEAENLMDPDLKKAIAKATRNIDTFHRSQQVNPVHITTATGVVCWQKPVAIQKVGLYVPGGTAPLFSTVLMLAIPARIAGCSEIILCTPPGNDGRIHHAVLYAAKLTGVTAVYKIGGAQAIAAMAYGTAQVPKVFKIFGPGNQYVTAAKQLVSHGDVAIDMPAGPSELAVIADDSAHPAFVASDLLSQAEHGADSQVLLVTTSEQLAKEVLKELDNQLELIPRKEIAVRALMHSKIIVLNHMSDVVDLVNEYAPEHLIIATDDAGMIADGIINAGSVFIGHYTPESAGDYASGTNHTLPTNGNAKAYNGVNLDDFVKKITFQQITRQGLENIGEAIMKMADAEALTAHSHAVSIRLKNGNHD
jgi:histidinol dehydrogenase